MSDDRTVHARYNITEVVRYDRSGKWYIELRDGSVQRSRVSVSRAAEQAAYGASQGGAVFFNLPGGQTFDRKVREIRNA